MVEGSQIDWAGHINNLEYLIVETLGYDKAVQTGNAEYCESIDLTKSDRHIRKQLTFFNPKEMHFIGTIENYEHDLRLLGHILDRDLAYYHNHRTRLILKPNHDQYKKIYNLFYEDYKFWEDIYYGF